MKKRLREKTARRWLNRNSWKIAKMELGIGASKHSCFSKQMTLCQNSLTTGDQKDARRD